MRYVSVAALVLMGVKMSSAEAQTFNIDFGSSLDTPPAESYGAGSGQAGFWNLVALTTPLRDTSGILTVATCSGAGGGSGSIEIPGATGDDELFMESTIAFPKNGNGVTIAHLVAGDYDLYAYGWNDNFFHAHTIGVNVFNGVTSVGDTIQTTDTWPGSQVLAQTYTRIRVQVLPDANFLNIRATNATFDYEILSGIQLVPIPAPGAVLPLLGAALLPRRKR